MLDAWNAGMWEEMKMKLKARPAFSLVRMMTRNNLQKPAETDQTIFEK